MADTKLYQYYEKQGILPTFGNFRGEEDLTRYEAGRRTVFAEKLVLPIKLFDGLKVLEFGPDSGENAMVFARWGARLTLVEPNPNALDQIRDYFARFGLDGQLETLVEADVEGFRTDDRFDLIDAEGFIYTIQPQTVWLDILAGLLAPEGLIVVSYYERRGGFFELALRACQAAGKAVSGLSADETARALFAAKWDSIPHTRSFASWQMDVLENPFVRRRTFLDAGSLIADAQARGLTVHASWPNYRDLLQVYWHKKVLPDGERLAADRAHLDRSCLSTLGAAKLYLTGPAEEVAQVAGAVDALVEAVDAAIEAPDAQRLETLEAALEAVSALAGTSDVLCDEPADLTRLRAALDALRRIFAAARAGDFAEMVRVATGDAAFLASWGQPAHFLVLRKRP
jgi:predicted O-methyltransferase YrrM